MSSQDLIASKQVSDESERGIVSEILPGKLYLTDRSGAQNQDYITNLGITHIYSLTNARPDISSLISPSS